MFKDLFSSTVNIVQGIAILLDATVGLFNLYHHHLGFGLFDLGLAALVLGLNISFNIFKRRTDRLREQIEELREADRRRQRRIPMSMDAYLKARDNLLHIVKVTGAIFDNTQAFIDPDNLSEGIRVTFWTGQSRFVIAYGRVSRYGLDDNDYNGSTTCYNMRVDMPHHEHIASALLLLKNDPTIFDRWMKQDAFYS